MKGISFLLLTGGILAAVAFPQTQLTPIDQVKVNPRKLSQIKVVEESKSVPQKPIKVKKRRLKLKPQVKFFRKLDQLISKYGLEKELDSQKLNRYFRGLGKRVFRQLRDRMIRPARLEEPFRSSVIEYKRVAEKYGIK